MSHPPEKLQWFLIDLFQIALVIVVGWLIVEGIIWLFNNVTIGFRQ